MASRLETGLVPFGHGSHAVVDPAPGLYAFWLRGTCLYIGMTENLERRMAEHESAEANPSLRHYFTKFPGEIEMSIAYIDADVGRLRTMESETIAQLRPLANAKNEGGVRP